MIKSMTKVAVVTASLSIVACGGDNGQKIAEVSGKTITAEQFDAFLKLKRMTPKDDAHRESILNEYLEREALAATIEKQDFLDKQTIAAELNEFRKEMLISRYFDRYLNEEVTDTAVLNYYNTNAAAYETKKAHVAHILVRTHRNMDEATRAAKLTTAQEAYSKIQAGEDFAEVAKTYSEDTISGKKGGDLGWLAQGAIDKRFSDVIFKLKKGTVSEPFETNFGFHVVKLLDAPTVVKKPFDSVKGRIRHQLRVETKEAELKKLLSETKISK